MLVLVLAFLVVQVVVGWRTRSLAVLSDAGHMATDALGIGMSLAAITAAARSAREARPTHRTFGWYRLEILAALANSALLLGVGVFVVVEAVRRFDDPPDVPSWPVLAIGVVGLAVNVGVDGAAAPRGGRQPQRPGRLPGGRRRRARLRGGDRQRDRDGAVRMGAGRRGDRCRHRAVHRARVHGSSVATPLRVLVQAAPAHLDPRFVEASLRAVDGVADVHDLHIWTLTSQMDVVTAHLRVVAGADPWRCSTGPASAWRSSSA